MAAVVAVMAAQVAVEAAIAEAVVAVRAVGAAAVAAVADNPGAARAALVVHAAPSVGDILTDLCKWPFVTSDLENTLVARYAQIRHIEPQNYSIFVIFTTFPPLALG